MKVTHIEDGKGELWQVVLSSDELNLVTKTLFKELVAIAISHHKVGNQDSLIDHPLGVIMQTILESTGIKPGQIGPIED